MNKVASEKVTRLCVLLKLSPWIDEKGEVSDRDMARFVFEIDHQEVGIGPVFMITSGEASEQETGGYRHDSQWRFDQAIGVRFSLLTISPLGRHAQALQSTSGATRLVPELPRLDFVVQSAASQA